MMNTCYSCGATYGGYSCPNCASIRAGRENAQKISDAIRDAEWQRQADIRREEQQRESEERAAREAVRRSLLTPEQRKQEDIERAEQARINAINLSIQNKENETHEKAVNAITFFVYSYVAIGISCYFSKFIYSNLNNPSSLTSPYKYIAIFYNWTVLIPFEILIGLFFSLKSLIYQKISYPNIALVCFGLVMIILLWLAVSSIYRIFRHIGSLLKFIFVAPFVFGLIWLIGSFLVGWLLKR